MKLIVDYIKTGLLFQVLLSAASCSAASLQPGTVAPSWSAPDTHLWPTVTLVLVLLLLVSGAICLFLRSLALRLKQHQRELENSLASKNADLDLLTRELQRRELALDEARLAFKQATTQADQARHSKAEFLATMNHEMRTPMNAIIGMANLALRTELTTRQRDYLEKLHHAGKHLLQTINDVLDLSRVDAGKLELDMAPFDLEQMLQKVVTLTADSAANKGLELLFDIGKDVPQTLMGDQPRLSQMLINYTSNAIKFTDKGHVALTVRVKKRTGQDVQLYFAVQDTGIGISQDQLQKLFQQFQQADSSTTRRHEGSGMGLAITKILAAQMGGEVGVKSEPAQGSTFWFTVRLQLAGIPEPAAPTRIETRGRRILVVDDLASARFVLSEMLAEMNMKTDLAESGSAALTRIGDAQNAGHPYEIILMDWKMPDMDGIETIRRIRHMQLDPVPHIAILTAFDSDDIRHLAGDVGVDHVLLKPIGPSRLHNSVIDMLSSTAPLHRSGPENPDRDLRGARLLLVEDNAINQQIASELLRDEGINVDIANNGEIACQYAKSLHYDLILMDIHMPVMDGIEATRQIRSLPSHATTPIIAMTANSMLWNRQRCLDAGMVDYMAKPIDPDDLVRVIRKWAYHGASTQGGTVQSITSPAAELAPTIQGLDRNIGMRLVGNKVHRYTDLLRGFVATQASAVDDIRAALAKQDHQAAMRLAHTLKGLAGNIASDALQLAASIVEQTLMQYPQIPELADQLTRLEKQLVGQIDAITRGLPPEQAIDSVPQVDMQELASACKQLKTLLVNYEGGAERVIKEKSALLAAAFPHHFPALQAAAGKFELERALQILEEATSQLTLD